MSFSTPTTYIGLFIGLLIGGETILVPAVYASFLGQFPPFNLLLIAIAATIISDSIWYAIGRYTPLSTLKHHKKYAIHIQKIDRVTAVVKRHGLKFLFLSKFVYGTRIMMQLLSGMEKIPFRLYTLVNTFAVIAYTAFLFVTAYLLKASLDQFELTLHTFRWAFALSFLLIISIVLWIAKKKSNSWFQS